MSILYCQNHSSTIKFLPTLTNINFTNNSFQMNLNSFRFNNANQLSLYNPTTNLNDNYYLVGEKYFMSNTKSFSFIGPDGQRIDSFNPSGTNDLRSALIVGAIHSLLDKL